MVEYLSVGMKLHAMYGVDGEFYPAEVASLSTSAKRKKTPVKIHYIGYETTDDAWVSLDMLKCKALPKDKKAAPTPAKSTKGTKAAAKAAPEPKAKAKPEMDAQNGNGEFEVEPLSPAKDYSALTKGMHLQAEADGKYWAAEVVGVSKKKKDTPVKVTFIGYDKQYDERLGADRHITIPKLEIMPYLCDIVDLTTDSSTAVVLGSHGVRRSAGAKHSDRDGLPKACRKAPSTSDVALKKVSTSPRDSSASSSRSSLERANSFFSSPRRARSSESQEYVTPDQVGTKEPPVISPQKVPPPKVRCREERAKPTISPERQKRREARTSSSSRSPEAKRQASSSGAQRSRASPKRGRLWGFDVGKYGRHLKEATADFFMRLHHAKAGDPPFGTYDTVKDEEGNFQSTLRLSERSRAAARLRKRQYEGEVCGTRIEAETSAARVKKEKNVRHSAKTGGHPYDDCQLRKFGSSSGAPAKKWVPKGAGEVQPEEDAQSTEAGQSDGHGSESPAAPVQCGNEEEKDQLDSEQEANKKLAEQISLEQRQRCWSKLALSARVVLVNSSAGSASRGQVHCAYGRGGGGSRGFRQRPTSMIHGADCRMARWDGEGVYGRRREGPGVRDLVLHSKREELEASSMIGQVFGGIVGSLVIVRCKSCTYESLVSRVEYCLCLTVTLGMTEEELRRCRQELYLDGEKCDVWAPDKSLLPALHLYQLFSMSKAEPLEGFKCDECKQEDCEKKPSSAAGRMPLTPMISARSSEGSASLQKIGSQCLGRRWIPSEDISKFGESNGGMDYQLNAL
eukprot:s1802_g17.t2